MSTFLGEGWGLPIIEAMAMGLPTIATNWSGQVDFMRADNAYPLRVEKLVPSWGSNFAPDQVSGRAVLHSVGHLWD